MSTHMTVNKEGVGRRQTRPESQEKITYNRRHYQSKMGLKMKQNREQYEKNRDQQNITPETKAET